MDTRRRQQLEQLVMLSKEMLVKASDCEWGVVAELECRRKELVLRCFQHPSRPQDAEEEAAAIRQILHLNQEISELGRRHQHRLAADIQGNKLGRTASAAYRGCAR